MNVRDHDYAPIVAKYYPLATRRLADEAIFLLKILNGFVDCPQLLNVINFHTASYFSRSSYTTLCPSPAHLAARIREFGHTLRNSINFLPTLTREKERNKRSEEEGLRSSLR